MAGAALAMQIGAMTDMGCDEPRMAQDTWVSEFLGSGPTATIDGDTLVLASAGVTMTLLDRQVADPDQPLEGTTWVLDAIEVGSGDTGAVSSVPAGVRATIRLEGGQLSVDTGCNTGGASATVDGSTLTIGPLGLTKRACQVDAAAVEQSMTQTLQGAVAFELDGQVLRLLGPTGGLDFRAE
jgi:heat shock protein HslJ